MRREWSFVYDIIIRVFTYNKTGFDQISLSVQNIVYSLAYGQALNIGKLIMTELCQRLSSSLNKRGNEIFLPHFIQSVLNFKNTTLIELSGMSKQRIGYPKFMSKILFGSFDSRTRWMYPYRLLHVWMQSLKDMPLHNLYFTLLLQKRTSSL